MRGHEAILAMRRRGRKPTMVRLELRSFSRAIPDWGLPDDMVIVEPTDVIARLDLLFVVGCLVLVDDQNAQRVRALADAALTQGARRVIAHLVAPRRDTFDLLEIHDTEQALSWPA